MLESATQLAEAADRAARRTEGATTASAEASSNVRDIASAADELAASVMEIDRQVAQSNAIAEKAVGEAERTNAAVQELDEAAKRIGDVVSLITDIAEQTNLLALNATIEAARAGEAGRGFAVVAGEVKALAGQTAKATEDIATQIADMQHATSRSIEAIEAIERTIRDIGAISGAIAAAVTEQGAATQEIARSVDDRRQAHASKPPRRSAASATRPTTPAPASPAVRVGGRRARRGRAPHPRPGRRVLRRSCARPEQRHYSSRTPPGCGAGSCPARPARRRTGCRASTSSGCAASQAPAAAAMRAAAAVSHRLGGVVERVARLHLDEHQHAAAPRHDVDLADRAAEAPRHDAIALGDQVGGGAAFRRQADAEGRDALRAAARRWHAVSVAAPSSSLR